MAKKNQLKTVKNKTSIAQTIVVNGRPITLREKEERSFVSEVADKFLAECKPYVVEVSDHLGAVQEDKLVRDTVWVANVTGDPDAPPTIKRRKFENKRWGDEEVPNPKAEPLDLVRFIDGGMVEYTTKDGVLEAKNMGKQEIRINAFKRIELPALIANWFLQRDGNQDVPMRGCAIRSRAPSNFEPDMGWDLDQMRRYLKLVDIKADLGPSDQEVNDRVLKKHGELLKTNKEEFYELCDIAVFDAKVTCMKRLFMRLVDPRYRLPTKKEFDSLSEPQPSSQAQIPTDVVIPGVQKSPQIQQARR